MKNFKISTFLIVIGLYVLLLIPSFLGAFAEDEGTIGDSFIWLIFSKLFYVLRFPTHTLFWSVFQEGHIYFAGFFINAVFYGLLLERFFYFLRKKNQ